ncbi:FAD binding domain-containing protein [Saccharospirillum impatiens]|uniref:FAD binding domain-containing protein n=1 Tax=Saccharospirillum impatiens TaxID=169438 RepID=UPI0003FAD102|nr:xanthine dehydrogenase family protein subunit M [Saccharospirillum impatiens]
MIPGVFDYHAPTTMADAIALLAQYGDEAKVLAGGHSLLPMMKLRFAEPAYLIDLNKINELRGISEANGMVRIGAMTTENQLIASDLLAQKCPLIPEAARLVADPQVRNRGTIGGDIAHGDPGNDHPAVMLAVGASFVLAGPAGERTVAADGFFLGTYWTGLEEGEILKEILVPPVTASTGHGYAKLKRKTGDYATAGAAVQLTLNGDVCDSINIGLTNVGACAIKATEAEDVLRGQVITEALILTAAEKAMAMTDPAEDLRGDVEYKTHMAGEMCRRALRQALARAKGGA